MSRSYTIGISHAMVTFHPSFKAIRTPQGTRYAPMVQVRNAKGQCVGSGCARDYAYEEKAAARNHARYEAHRVAERLEFARVA